MDHYPGAYPETPTPQHHQQEPQYPVQQQSQRQPLGGLTEQAGETPAQHDPLATQAKPQDITASHAHTDSGVGLSHADYHRPKARTLDDKRSPSVDEAVGGGTYVRPDEGIPTRDDIPILRRPSHERIGSPGWTFSPASLQHEQQPHKVQHHHPEGTQREVQHSQTPHHPPHQSRAVHQEAGDSSLSHDHQLSDVPVAYQQHAREVPQQPHQTYQQPQAVQQEPHAAHGMADLSRGHEPSDLPLAYQENTGSQQTHDDQSHSRAEKGLAAGALAGAGAGVAAHEYSRKHDEPSQQSRAADQQPRELRHESRELSQQPRQAEQQSTTGPQSGAGSRDQASTSSTPPYWGALPTAATGGIYNTVTGHGSTRDDHDHHHNVAPKDRAAEGTAADGSIPHAATSFPTGGVYNSVIGHGSGNEQEGAHSADRSTHGGAGTQRAFPLATSERGAHDDESHSRTQKGLAAGALAGAGVAAYEYSGRNDQQAGHDTRDVAGSQGQVPIHAEQRASQAQPASHQPQKLEKRTYPDDKDKHRERHGLFGFGGKRDKEDRHDAPVAEHRVAQAQAAPRDTQTDERQKGHHGLFGIAGKHDMAEGRDPTAEHSADPSTQPAGAEHRLVEPKPQAAAVSPPNAEEKQKGHHGLFKHGNDDGRSPRDIAPIPGTHPAENRASATPAQPISPANAEAKRSSIDGRDSPKKKEHGGLFGIFHRHKDEKKEDEPKEHRRSSSIERHNTLKKTPPPKVAQAVRTSTPPKHSIEEETHRSAGTEHDHKGALATSAGVAAGGVAASELAHRHADSHEGSSQPSAAQTAPHGAAQAGAYQNLPPGTSSGVATGATSKSQPVSAYGTSQGAQDSYSREAGSGHSGPYNNLADGTPSGIATSRAAQQETSSSAAYNDTAAGQSHDRLNTGTAAGIAAGAGAAGLYASTRDTKDSEHYDTTRGQPGSDTFGSTTHSKTAATSGDNWRSELPPTVATSRVGDTSGTHTTTTTHDRQMTDPATSQATGTTRDTATHATGTTGPYNALESGTASGVAAGAATSHGTASHDSREDAAAAAAAPLTQRHRDDHAGKGGDLPKPYNVLPSGTPSGVNIEYRRKSREIERRD